MAAEIVEIITSRPGIVDEAKLEGNEWHLHYHVTGTADETEVAALASLTAPLTYNGLLRNRINITPLYVDTASPDGIDAGLWEVIVDYGTREAPDKTGVKVSLSFDTTGGTQHVTVSKLTRYRIVKTGEPYAASNFHQVIGWNGEEAEGVDIVVPKCTFTLKRTIPRTQWTPTYFGKLYALTGKFNQAAFLLKINNGTTYSFAAGEVLFLGCRFDEEKGGDYIEIEYSLAAAKTQTFAAGAIPGFPAFSKYGWDYMWIYYRKEEDTDSKMVVGRPYGIYMEQIYDPGDFNDLNP